MKYSQCMEELRSIYLLKMMRNVHETENISKRIFQVFNNVLQIDQMFRNF